jgi:hypothetical protein
VQAAYERQRELKATYQAVAHALKPALQELAERSIDEAVQNPDLHKQSDQHAPVVKQLQRNFHDRIAQLDRVLDHNLVLADGIFQSDQYVTEQIYKVSPTQFTNHIAVFKKTNLISRMASRTSNYVFLRCKNVASAFSRPSHPASFLLM